jgi:ATP-dependent DNA helicase RecG
MESDRTASTFTIRLLLCHFFSEETLDWLKRFAAYELNDNQRTALVFLREVGALDAVAYRQLTGCNPKLVAKELAGIKTQGLMIQKGRARGTYYVPSETLLMSTPQAETTTPRTEMSTPQAETTTPRTEMSTPQAANTTPRAVTGTVQAVTGTPQGHISQPHGLISQPRGLISQPRGLISQPRGLISQPPDGDMPIALAERLKVFPRRTKGNGELLSIIVDLCAWRPQTSESLAQMLRRSPEYIRKFAARHIGKELDYLYPMMPHQPRQAYVVKVGVGIGS